MEAYHTIEIQTSRKSARNSKRWTSLPKIESLKEFEVRKVNEILCHKILSVKSTIDKNIKKFKVLKPKVNTENKQ
jgi:hypothetical protein